jgi:hypothetical protein
MNRLILIFNSLASIGVLIGLALVVLQLLQLNQAEELAQQERIVGYFGADSSANIFVIGEEFAETLVRIQSAPDTVTQADLVRFDHWASHILSMYSLVPDLLDSGNVCANFDSAVGRHFVDWILKNRPDSKSLQKVQEYLRNCTHSTFLEYMTQKGT